MSLSNIEPQIIWKNFSKLNAVPRPSKKEARVIEFIKNFGESLNLNTENQQQQEWKTVKLSFCSPTLIWFVRKTMM